MSRRNQSLYDRYITIFSPEGKLYQVEYAIQAVETCGLTAVALKGPTSACVVVQKKVPLQQAQQDKLLDPSSITSLHHITDHIGSAMIGLPGDCRSMVYRARQIAADNEFKLGHKLSVQYLTYKVANLNQVYAQHAYMRLHACCGIFLAIDEDLQAPEIYKFDPAGWYAGYKACASGKKERDCAYSLEKILKSKQLETEKDVIEEALACLQSVLALDFKANEVEIGVVSLKQPTFRRLDEATIDFHLSCVAERD